LQREELSVKKLPDLLNKNAKKKSSDKKEERAQKEK